MLGVVEIVYQSYCSLLYTEIIDNGAHQKMILGAEALQRATIPLAGVQRRKVAPTAADMSATDRP